MSVLIKGMEMPKHAGVNEDKDTVYRCIVIAHPDNSAEFVIDTKFASAYDNGHNIQRYLITEIPTPHGRLIDADRLLAVLKSMASTSTNVPTEAVIGLIDNQPVIVEKERNE